MGREIYTVITDKNGKVVWNSADDQKSYFCGRYDYTNVIARFCYNRGDAEQKFIRRNGEEVDMLAIEFTDKAIQRQIVNELNEVQEEYAAKHQSLEDEYADLRECRRHATTIENFYDFDNALHDVAIELRETYWNGALDAAVLTKNTRKAAHQLAMPDSVDVDAIGEYRLFWICSE